MKPTIEPIRKEILVECPQFRVARRHACGHFVERFCQRPEFIVSTHGCAGGDIAGAHLFRCPREFGERMGDLTSENDGEEDQDQCER